MRWMHAVVFAALAAQGGVAQTRPAAPEKTPASQRTAPAPAKPEETLKKGQPAQRQPVAKTPAAAADAGVTLPNGLRYWELKVGTGAEAVRGRYARVHYTGTLTNGRKFDSSLDSNQPLDFRIGAGQVIQGWDEGVVGMKVGGKRKLRIPPALAYGDRSPGAGIPPNATLVFVIELLRVE